MPYKRKAASIIGAQVASQTLEKRMIRCRVAVEAGCHQSSKLALVRMGEFVHL
jgi:hypothetical protein